MSFAANYFHSNEQTEIIWPKLHNILSSPLSLFLFCAKFRSIFKVNRPFDERIFNLLVNVLKYNSLLINLSGCRCQLIFNQTCNTRINLPATIIFNKRNELHSLISLILSRFHHKPNLYGREWKKKLAVFLFILDSIFAKNRGNLNTSIGLVQFIDYIELQLAWIFE